MNDQKFSLAQHLGRRLADVRIELYRAEDDPQLQKDAAKWTARVQELMDEIRSLEYWIEVANRDEKTKALDICLDCLKTIRQLDTSSTPEFGQPVNGVMPEKGRGRLNTPRESAEATLFELNSRGFITAGQYLIAMKGAA